MRLAVGLFLATIVVAGAGVYFVNSRVGGVDAEDQLPPGRLTLLDDSLIPAATASVAAPAKPTIFVSGCFESNGECRCIDKQGQRIPVDQLTHDDCRAMLKIAPKQPRPTAACGCLILAAGDSLQTGAHHAGIPF
jgi:hypothetical protein